MHVEGCCQALLIRILHVADKKRTGVCIDVGVGTFAFFCELFARLGFQAVAVEPLPVNTLRRLCHRYGITLVESCLSDIDGVQTLHIGTFHGAENLNLCSLVPHWWGVSTKTQQVQSTTMSTLLSTINAETVTCLKLDVEGMESTIIRQFLAVPESLLPSVVMFEYGGGDNREGGRAGWSQEFLAGTIECLDVLKKCGYGFSIGIDSAPDTVERIFDLQSCNLTPDQFFHPHAIYGNIISLRGFVYPETEVKRICTAYRDNDSPAPALKLPYNHLRGLLDRFRRALKR